MTLRYNGVTGHRGNPECAPENTIAGFESAIGLGVDFLETDVHETSDGVLVLSHDGTTGRCCGTDLVIRETSFAELRKLNASFSFNPGCIARIPTLEEALELLAGHPDVRLSLQPKCPAVKAICDSVRASGLADRIAFNDGNFGYLSEAKERLQEATIFYDTTTIDQLERGIAEAAAAGFFGLVAHKDSLTRERVDAVREAGLEPGVWTVNDESEMRNFLKVGVFRFYTDRPSLLLKIREES